MKPAVPPHTRGRTDGLASPSTCPTHQPRPRGQNGCGFRRGRESSLHPPHALQNPMFQPQVPRAVKVNGFKNSPRSSFVKRLPGIPLKSQKCHHGMLLKCTCSRQNSPGRPQNTKPNQVQVFFQRNTPDFLIARPSAVQFSELRDETCLHWDSEVRPGDAGSYLQQQTRFLCQQEVRANPRDQDH